MVFIHVAATFPVNPPSSTTILTHDELWAALLEKARRPELFLPVIERSEIIREDTRGLTRRAVLKPAPAPASGEESRDGGSDKGKEMQEVVTYKGKTRMDFHDEKSGQFVMNIISGGESGKPEDLYLTFVFDWPHPEIEDENEDEDGEQARQGKEEEVRKLRERYAKMSTQAVAHTMEVARRMKMEGKLLF